MAGHVYQQIYNCTPAQLEVALITTLPAVGFAVTRASQKYQGLIVGTAAGTGTSAGLGQVDWSYDGKYYLMFYGANVVPTPIQANAGIQDQQLSTALVILLNSTLAGTLGAPVPVNLANTPSNQNDA